MKISTPSPELTKEMSNKLKDIIIYFCKHYPYPQELTIRKMERLIYLADWKSVLKCGKQITDIQWKRGHYAIEGDKYQKLITKIRLKMLENNK